MQYHGNEKGKRRQRKFRYDVHAHATPRIRVRVRVNYLAVIATAGVLVDRGADVSQAEIGKLGSATGV